MYDAKIPFRKAGGINFEHELCVFLNLNWIKLSLTQANIHDPCEPLAAFASHPFRFIMPFLEREEVSWIFESLPCERTSRVQKDCNQIA